MVLAPQRDPNRSDLCGGAWDFEDLCCRRGASKPNPLTSRILSQGSRIWDWASRIWFQVSNPNLLTAHAAGPCSQIWNQGWNPSPLIPMPFQGFGPGFEDLGLGSGTNPNPSGFEELGRSSRIADWGLWIEPYLIL